MRLSLVGASGLVGREMIKVIEEHRLKIDAFYPVAFKDQTARVDFVPVRGHEDTPCRVNRLPKHASQIRARCQSSCRSGSERFARTLQGAAPGLEATQHPSLG